MEDNHLAIAAQLNIKFRAIGPERHSLAERPQRIFRPERGPATVSNVETGHATRKLQFRPMVRRNPAQRETDLMQHARASHRCDTRHELGYKMPAPRPRRRLRRTAKPRRPVVIKKPRQYPRRFAIRRQNGQRHDFEMQHRIIVDRRLHFEHAGATGVQQCAHIIALRLEGACVRTIPKACCRKYPARSGATTMCRRYARGSPCASSNGS